MSKLDGFGKIVNGMWSDAKTPWHKRMAMVTAGFSTLFDFEEEISLDYESQITYAKEIGILAGMSENAEDFTERFREYLRHDLELNVE
ncbi:MAG: hypothetical protein G01um101444_477 [Parcubacteria group bacterium Gr01-1014_44]|nr:MAG: hypothetical protein G01um101444_477 [Parcubacteria group bacterium Gr01-1014_44]